MPNKNHNSRTLQSFSLSSIYNKAVSTFKSCISGHRDTTADHFREGIIKLQSKGKKMSSEEKRLFGNFLQFCDKSVEDVMIPRSDIFALESNASLDELKKAIVENGHTRTLIYEDTLDNIIGFVHMKDVFDVIVSQRSFNLKKILRKHIIAAPSMKLIDLLADMQAKRTHIAVIIDEYGGTDGIATIEDIMESIVDKIEDEHDDGDENTLYNVINKNEFITSARMGIEEIEKTLGMKLKGSEDDCDTIGGLVIARVGNIPVTGTVIDLTTNVKAEIMESTPRALKKIKIIRT